MSISHILAKVRESKPLVHHITNWVTIYDCAAITRAAGALPVMAHAEEEVSEMAGIADALVLNIGTPTPQLISSMILAGKKANERGIPVVLDAVGAGATRLRSEKAKEIMSNVELAVIKGNKSEVAVLAGFDAKTKGVEAGEADGNPSEIAMGLAQEEGIVVVITGKTDIVAGPEGRLFFIENGHEMMGSVVGTGCMATSLLGAFCAVEEDYPLASAAALSCFGIAGELAARKASAPIAFKGELIDAVYSLSMDDVERMAKVIEGGKC